MPFVYFVSIMLYMSTGQSNLTLESVSISEPLQNRQHAQKPLMLSTPGSKGKKEGG